MSTNESLLTSASAEDDAPICVVLMTDAEAGPSQTVELKNADRVSFGSCDCADCGSGIVVRSSPGYWIRGEIQAHSDYWRVSNRSRRSSLFAVNLEDEAQLVEIPPGRVDVPMPFELGAVEFRDGRRVVSERLKVFGPEPAAHAEDHRCSRQPANALVASLRPDTAHMAVLQMLVGVADETGSLPSSSAIADRLNARGWKLTKRAVDHHIDYLYRRVFPNETAGPRGAKRQSLVAATQEMATSLASIGSGGAQSR